MVATPVVSPYRTDSDVTFLRSLPRVVPHALAATGTPEPTEAVTVTVPPETIAPPEAPVYVTPDVPTGPDLEERLALRQMVCDAFADPFMCDEVVWRESIGDWNPNWRCHVYGPCWSPTNDCGLMQTNAIHAWRYEALGYPIEVGCFIPAVNIQVAQGIYADQGPGAWTTYR